MTVPVLAASMLLAGLGSSLHCIGMCGPLLIGFGRAFGEAAETRSRAGWALVPYHLGRIWTYTLLGLGAGLAGRGLVDAATVVGWQRPVMIAAAALVLVSGVLLLGVVPGVRLERALACAVSRLRTRGPLRALTDHGGVTARLLLGAVMGLLPCGLLYAMLALAAATASPVHGALAMLAFGLGTVPALTAVRLAERALLPAWLRVHGTRIAAVAIVLTGGVMLSRALVTAPAAGPACHASVVASPR